MHVFLCAWLVLIAARITAAQKTVTIVQGRELVAAVQDQVVGRIVVCGPALALESSVAPGSTLCLRRNFTITSNPAGPHQLRKKLVDAACVAQANPAICIRQGMDKDHYCTHSRPGAAQLSTTATASIGAVLTGAVIAAVAALKRIRQRQQVEQQRKKLWPVHAKLGGGGISSGSAGEDSPPASSYRAGSSDSAGSGGLMPPWLQLSEYQDSSARRSSQAMRSILKGTLTAEQAADLCLGQMIGAGSSGRVFKGWLGEKEVAIKLVHHNIKQALAVAAEVELMMALTHRNLVKAFHYVTWGSTGGSEQMSPPSQRVYSLHSFANTSSGYSSNTWGGSANTSSGYSSNTWGGSNLVQETWIVEELANAGNLQDAVLARNEGVFMYNNQPHMGMILKTLVGVAEGMQWLHSNNTVHGDLKAANVMLTVEPTDRQADNTMASKADNDVEYDLFSEVTDFGLSRVMCDGMTHLFTNTVGTITHQPPELMGSGHFSKAADVFSFGVLMWEVFMCAQPWKGKLIGEIIALVLVEGHRLQFSPLIPKAYADLAVQCWAEAPTARPTFADIVARLQQLAEVEDELQAEVARAYGNVVQSWAVHSDAEDE